MKPAHYVTLNPVLPLLIICHLEIIIKLPLSASLSAVFVVIIRQPF